MKYEFNFKLYLILLVFFFSSDSVEVEDNFIMLSKKFVNK